MLFHVNMCVIMCLWTSEGLIQPAHCTLNKNMKVKEYTSVRFFLLVKNQDFRIKIIEYVYSSTVTNMLLNF